MLVKEGLAFLQICDSDNHEVIYSSTFDAKHNGMVTIMLYDMIGH